MIQIQPMFCAVEVKNWEDLVEHTIARTGQKLTDDENRALRGTERQAASPPKAGSKFRNRRVKYDGKTFDSERERDRYLELRIMEQAGVIWKLQHHKRFTLQSCGADLGQSYEADFFYEQESDAGVWSAVVEDVKPSFRDERAEKRYRALPHYRLSALKQAILRAMGYDVREV